MSCELASGDDVDQPLLQARDSGRPWASVLISMCSSMPLPAKTSSTCVERRDALAAAVAQLRRRKLGRGPVGDRPRAFGRALERRIVDHDQLAVARGMDVELDALDAERARALESRRGCSPARGCARRDGR